MVYIEKTKNEIAPSILDQAFKIHRVVGPGLLESVYEKCLQYELKPSVYRAETQVPVPMNYKSIQFKVGFKIDFLVEERVVVEDKSSRKIGTRTFCPNLDIFEDERPEIGVIKNFNTKYLKMESVE